MPGGQSAVGEHRQGGGEQGGTDRYQRDLPAGHSARDDGAHLDVGGDRGRCYIPGSLIGLQPGERGRGPQDGGGPRL